MKKLLTLFMLLFATFANAEDFYYKKIMKRNDSGEFVLDKLQRGYTRIKLKRDNQLFVNDVYMFGLDLSSSVVDKSNKSIEYEAYDRFGKPVHVHLLASNDNDVFKIHTVIIVYSESAIIYY